MDSPAWNITASCEQKTQPSWLSDFGPHEVFHRRPRTVQRDLSDRMTGLLFKEFITPEVHDTRRQTHACRITPSSLRRTGQARLHASGSTSDTSWTIKAKPLAKRCYLVYRVYLHILLLSAEFSKLVMTVRKYRKRKPL